MNIAAIVCEYNPLHNGHIHHINLTKKLTNCDYLICIMSGNFTQRGMPCCMDKYTRATHAILGGADAVIELPTIYATSSAEYFALGAVKTLSLIKDIKYLSFGSECGDIDMLKKTISISSSDEYKQILRLELDKGIAYPIASTIAFKAVGEQNDIFTLPNNILACEYIKALNSIASSIIPITIPRLGNGYHNLEISNFSSSTAIRNAVKKGQFTNLGTPEYVVQEIINAPKIDSNRIFSIVCEKLLSPPKDLYEGQEGLVNRLAKSALTSNSLEELIEATHTKRYTKSRIRRLIIHVLLGHTQDMVNIPIDYTNTLAISNACLDLLKTMPARKSDSLLYANDLYANEMYRIIGGKAIVRNSHIIVK